MNNVLNMNKSLNIWEKLFNLSWDFSNKFKSITLSKDRDKVEEIKYITKHEVWHALISILYNLTIYRFKVYKFRQSFSNVINKIISKNYNLWEVSTETYLKDDGKIMSLYFLSWLWNTVFNDNDDYSIKTLDIINNFLFYDEFVDWDDIKNPYSYIEWLFYKINKRKATKQEMKDIFILVLKEISKIFSWDDFKKSSDLLTEEIMRRWEIIWNINDKILNIFKQNGITSEKIEDMRKKIDEFDFEKIIYESTVNNENILLSLYQ